jgi:hypothetical protein
MATGTMTQEDIAVIKGFIEQGGTLLLILDSMAGLNSLSLLTEARGLSATEARVQQYAMLGQIDFSHPVFAPFADSRYSDFTKIHFWKHRDLPTNGLAAARVLARFDDESPALMEIPTGRGQLFVLTSGWQPADSQLALSSKFVPLLYSLLDYSGALPSDSSSYFVGEQVPLNLERDDVTQTVRKPDGTETNVTGMSFFTDTDQPGLYAMGSEGKPREFSVNVAPEESRTAALSIDALESLGVPVRLDSITQAIPDPSNGRQLQAAELESRQKLWRWILLAALGLLLIEIWLGGRPSRRPVGEATL